MEPSRITSDTQLQVTASTRVNEKLSREGEKPLWVSVCRLIRTLVKTPSCLSVCLFTQSHLMDKWEDRHTCMHWRTLSLGRSRWAIHQQHLRHKRSTNMVEGSRTARHMTESPIVNTARGYCAHSVSRHIASCSSSMPSLAPQLSLTVVSRLVRPVDTLLDESLTIGGAGRKK